MSVASANFFSVLVEEPSVPEVGTGAVHLEKGQPKVGQSTSSKKVDQNPRADPAKARKKSSGPPSNDRVLRENRDGGRANNKKVGVKEGQSSHSSRRHDRSDRQNLGGKRDTSKRVRASWGDDSQAREDELAGEELASEDAQAEEAEERENRAAVEAQRVTLEQYLQSQKEEKQSLNTRKTGSGAGLSSSDKSPLANATELKHTPEVEEPEARKKLRTKQRKEVQTLVPDFSAARPRGERSERPERTERGRSSAPRGERAERGERAPRTSAPRGDRPARQGKPGSKPTGKPAGGKPAPKGAKAPKKPSAPKVDLSSLPTLG